MPSNTENGKQNTPAVGSGYVSKMLNAQHVNAHAILYIVLTGLRSVVGYWTIQAKGKLHIHKP